MEHMGKEIRGDPKMSNGGIKTVIVGDNIYMSVSGRLVHGDSAYAVEGAVHHYTTFDARQLIMDLHSVNKIDAAGLGVLTFAYSIARQAGIKLILVNTPPIIQRLLALTKLDTIIQSASIGDDCALGA